MEKKDNNQTDAGLPKQNDAANNGDPPPGATLALPRRPLREYRVLDRPGHSPSPDSVLGTCGVHCQPHEACICYIACAFSPGTTEHSPSSLFIIIFIRFIFPSLDIPFHLRILPINHLALAPPLFLNTHPHTASFMMARYFQTEFYQQSPSTLDVAEDDEMSVLDDKILEPGSEDLADTRRSSYDAPAYSHRDSVWSNYSNTSSNQSRPTSHMGQPMVNSSGAPFMPVDGPHSTSFHPTSWSMPRNESGSCTPTAGYDQYSTEGEQSTAAPFSGGAVGPVSALPMNSMSYRNGMFGQPGSVAMSPQSSQGWMPAPMDLVDTTSHSNKSPSYRNDSPLTMRRDGIRKKNARFEIPAERTLSTIDHLISQSTNEEEIKELKQQKRLLRNRQAA